MITSSRMKLGRTLYDIVDLPLQRLARLAAIFLPVVVLWIPQIISSNPILMASVIGEWNSFRISDPAVLRSTTLDQVVTLDAPEQSIMRFYPLPLALLCAIAIFFAIRTLLKVRLADVPPMSIGRLAAFAGLFVLMLFATMIAIAVGALPFYFLRQAGFESLGDPSPSNFLFSVPVYVVPIFILSTATMTLGLCLPAVADGHPERGILRAVGRGFRQFPRMLVINGGCTALFLLAGAIQYKYGYLHDLSLQPIAGSEGFPLAWTWKKTLAVLMELTSPIVTLFVVTASYAAVHVNLFRSPDA